jgi:hypothetical protein
VSTSLQASCCALLVLALAGCSVSPEAGIADAKYRYLRAKDACDANFPHSMVQQADCHTRAANAYIRPYFRYGDLMTLAQQQRMALAIKVDQHAMSLATYNRRLAQSEREVAKEEDRRNRNLHTTSSFESTPFTPVVSGFARLFQ